MTSSEFGSMIAGILSALIAYHFLIGNNLDADS